jgi:hypothetical protein
MKKQSFVIIGVSIIVLSLACSNVETTNQASISQFVIEGIVPDSSNPNCWFNVINIENGNSKCVSAVKELDGSYYLPIYSRLPSFNDKIVEGKFIYDSTLGMIKKDTLFEVTQMVRDTTGPFPH